MCRCRHHVSMRQWRWMHAACDKAGEMRHIHHEESADRVSNLSEGFEVDHARIGRAPRDDELWLMLPRKTLDLVHIDQMILFAHAILDGVEPFAGLIGRSAMREMAARSKTHAED